MVDKTRIDHCRDMIDEKEREIVHWGLDERITSLVDEDKQNENKNENINGKRKKGTKRKTKCKWIKYFFGINLFFKFVQKWMNWDKY